MTPASNSSTTPESVAGEPGSRDSLPFLYTVSLYIWYFVSPTILLLGNFGNVMTIVIMRRMKADESVINLYFIALAAVDLVSLDVFLLGEWVGMTFGFFIHYQNDVLCKLFLWSLVSTTMGGWFLVGLTVHRAISVVWPHRVNLLCTRRLVAGVIAGMAVFLSLAYCHYLYGYELRYSEEAGEHSCTLRTGSYLTFMIQVFTYVDMALYSILPFTCIIFANSVLVWTLRGTVKTARDNLAERDSVQARKKTAFSVTRTVIVVCTAYVVLTLPATLDYIFVSLFLPTAVVRTPAEARTYLSSLVMHMLMFANNAVNFYLYCLTGKRFRREFFKIFSVGQ